MREQDRSASGRGPRTIPTTTPEPVPDRPAVAGFDPDLVDAAASLLPPSEPSPPATWESWSVHDQPGDEPGTHEPEVTTAAEAGWPYHPAPPAAPPSWVGMVTAVPAPELGQPVARQRELAPADTSTAHPVPAAPSPRPAPTVEPADFAARLRRGVTLAATTDQLLALTTRAAIRLVPHAGGRWLVEADGALRERAAIGDGTRPGCAVTEPAACPAIATATAHRFDASDEIDACPHLAAAAGPVCTAVCVPVTDGGPLAGVLSVTGPPNRPPDPDTVELLRDLAHTVAARAAELDPAP